MEYLLRFQAIRGVAGNSGPANRINPSGFAFPPMQIQSQALLAALIPGTYVLRSETRQLLNPAIDYTEAVSLTVRGQIEGIATPAGRIKYLRLLSEAERPKVDAATEFADDS